MRTTDEIRGHLSRLKDESRQRAQELNYAVSDGLRKADCGLVLTSLGQFLGYSVGGLEEWRGLMGNYPQHLNPSTDTGEICMPYPGTKNGACDYAWKTSKGAVHAVFEVDGRDNSASGHLPVSVRTPTVVRSIKQHVRPGETKNFATNNLFKLSGPVLTKELGYVPAIRAWVLFQIRNHPDSAAKKPWGASPANWKTYFSQCPDLEGATMFGDSELFEDSFIRYVCARI